MITKDLGKRIQEHRKEYKSTYADVCFLHGKTIMSSDKYINKSITLLEKANALKNDNDYKYELAKAYYSDNQFERALEILPNTKKPYYIVELKAQILTALNRFDDSNCVLFHLIKYRTKDYLYRRISENYISLNKLDDAEKYALKALSSGKENYKNYYNYGLILKQKKQYLQANSYFENARRIKQSKFNYDCIEAIEQIEDIQAVIGCASFDEKTEDVGLNRSGIIEKYNNQRGFGFIRDDINSESIFFHVSDFKGNKIREGNIVRYSVEITSKGKKAINVVVI